MEGGHSCPPHSPPSILKKSSSVSPCYIDPRLNDRNPPRIRPENVYRFVAGWAKELGVEDSLLDTVHRAAESPPSDYVSQQGWVLKAFQNALWQLTHASNLEEAVVGTVMRGGDSDTNAAICGALLGAVYGRDAIPDQWAGRLLNCRPEAGRPNVYRPRPECFWPVDVLELAERLIR